MPYADRTKQLEYWKEYGKKHYKQYYDSFRRGILRARNIEMKTAIFSYYSGGTPKCACCGEKESDFLTVDHIEGGGKKQRDSLKRHGAYFYYWLVKNNFPEGFQILCFNCNSGRALFKNKGICPHKLKKP